MGGHIPDEDIERVKTSVDIVEVIQRFVPLKKAGRNFVGLCPFHQENTPSFNVNPERQIFKCFGCGKAGSVFTFLMEHARMDFPAAVRALAEEAGIEIRTSNRQGGHHQGDLRKRLFDVTHFTASFFRRTLLSPTGSDARAYLEARGITAEVAEGFGIGYAPPGWSSLIDAGRERRITPETFEKAGLAVPRRQGDGFYDRFRGRVIFPILDLQGRVLGFGGRILTGDGPKYINSPETPIYNKGLVLYGLPVARDHDTENQGIILVEGYTDVIALHTAGFQTAIASLGTALTREQVNLARRFASKIFLVYDGDAAGLAAMERGVELLLHSEIDIRIVRLPGGADPDDFIAEKGAEAFAELLKHAPDFFDFKLGMLAEKLDLGTAVGKSRSVDELLALVLTVPNPVHRSLLVRRVGDAIGVDALSVERRAGQMASPPTRAKAPKTAPRPKAATARLEADILEALLGDNRLIETARSRFPLDRFCDAEIRDAATIAYRLHDQGRAVGLADVLREAPQGILRQLVDRIERHAARGRPRDYEGQLNTSFARYEKKSRADRIREIQGELRKSENDHNHKEDLLRQLQDLL